MPKPNLKFKKNLVASVCSVSLVGARKSKLLRSLRKMIHLTLKLREIILVQRLTLMILKESLTLVMMEAIREVILKHADKKRRERLTFTAKRLTLTSLRWTSSALSKVLSWPPEILPFVKNVRQCLVVRAS